MANTERCLELLDRVQDALNVENIDQAVDAAFVCATLAGMYTGRVANVAAPGNKEVLKRAVDETIQVVIRSAAEAADG